MKDNVLSQRVLNKLAKDQATKKIIYDCYEDWKKDIIEITGSESCKLWFNCIERGVELALSEVEAEIEKRLKFYRVRAWEAEDKRILQIIAIVSGELRDLKERLLRGGGK